MSTPENDRGEAIWKKSIFWDKVGFNSRWGNFDKGSVGNDLTLKLGNHLALDTKRHA